MPMTPPAPQMPVAPAQPQADIISPNEAKFWQEWAAKAPGLIRVQSSESIRQFQSAVTPYKVGGIGLGAALGIATFTKHIPGYWKILSGAVAGGALAFGLAVGSAQGAIGQTEEIVKSYANALEKSPELREQLAHALSASVTAEQIQQVGIEKAVAQQAVAMGIKMAMYQIGSRQGQELGIAYHP